MPLGLDKQIDLPYLEQEKIYKRLELKNRLKAEGIRRRYDPFLQLKGVIFSDPAQERYSDMRKKGRLPGTPMRPGLFFQMLAVLFVPIIGGTMLMEWERRDYLKLSSTGDYPLEKVMGKSFL